MLILKRILFPVLLRQQQPSGSNLAFLNVHVNLGCCTFCDINNGSGNNGLHKDVEGSVGMAVGRVGLLSLLYCTLLPAGVDGFTRLCRNKTCIVLHQVGVSFDLYCDARKHKIKIRILVVTYL